MPDHSPSRYSINNNHKTYTKRKTKATPKSPPKDEVRRRGISSGSTASPARFRWWACEVLQVLDKPAVAVCIFIFGVVIIVIASKQVKFTFDLLESHWGWGRPQDGFIGNFMVVFVFMYVWIDTILLQWARAFGGTLFSIIHRRYNQIVEALEKIQEQDELEELQRRSLLRKKREKKAVGS